MQRTIAADSRGWSTKARSRALASYYFFLTIAPSVWLRFPESSRDDQFR